MNCGLPLKFFIECYNTGYKTLYGLYSIANHIYNSQFLTAKATHNTMGHPPNRPSFISKPISFQYFNLHNEKYKKYILYNTVFTIDLNALFWYYIKFSDY